MNEMEYWLGPNIGSDFVKMFRRRGGWKAARKNIDTISFYVQNLTDESKPLIGPNSFEAFRNAGAFEWLARKEIKIAVEGALYKEEQDTDHNVDRLATARRNVVKAGRCRGL